MKKFFIIKLICFTFFCFSIKAQESKSLIVFAEPNLSIVLTELVRLYSQEHNVITSINFNSPADLIGDIDMGDPADVVITAHKEAIETLKLKGLVDVYNIGNIAKDSINLVTSIKNSQIPTNLLDGDINMDQALSILNERRSTLILDNYGSSSGRYSGDYLRNLNLGKFSVFTKLAEDRSSIVTSVLSDDNHYALLLSTQIKNKSGLRVLASQESDITYKLLVIAGDNMDTARKFLRFLESNQEARQIFATNGLNSTF